MPNVADADREPNERCLEGASLAPKNPNTKIRLPVFSQPPRSGGNLCEVLPVSLGRRRSSGRAIILARFARHLAGPSYAALRSLVCYCASPRIGFVSLLRSPLSVIATFARFASARRYTFLWPRLQQLLNLFAFVSPSGDKFVITLVMRHLVVELCTVQYMYVHIICIIYFGYMCIVCQQVKLSDMPMVPH